MIVSKLKLVRIFNDSIQWLPDKNDLESSKLEMTHCKAKSQLLTEIIKISKRARFNEYYKN